jgi:hypothetical protein
MHRKMKNRATDKSERIIREIVSDVKRVRALLMIGLEKPKQKRRTQ